MFPTSRLKFTKDYSEIFLTVAQKLNKEIDL